MYDANTNFIYFFQAKIVLIYVVIGLVLASSGFSDMDLDNLKKTVARLDKLYNGRAPSLFTIGLRAVVSFLNYNFIMLQVRKRNPQGSSCF